ncbi:hypothetical protein [Salibacterium salarium]|uniref:hypothetical protein n=1 Tax=Salibacterium salarium TaxID=284579 RepID=UPI001639EE5E|nr:hypothetical protein [Salibacterium salarium]
MAKYDNVSSKVDEYLHHYFAERDPELKEIYKEQGLIPAEELEEEAALHVTGYAL